MLIDNSQAKTFLDCPAKWQERYLFNIEPKIRGDALSFGTRMHQLLEQRHQKLKGQAPAQYPALSDEALEDEAQEMYAAYEAYYPIEPFEVIDVERYFEVALPGSSHTYHGEFDGIVRDYETGRLQLLETKTESRSSRANEPVAWQSRSQVGLYLHAAERLYNEPFGGIVLNILKRRSEKGQVQCSFRRDILERTEWQKREAVENIIWVADQIEEMKGKYGESRWPANRNLCVEFGGWKCPYFSLHETEERSEELVKIAFRPAEQYLAL